MTRLTTTLQVLLLVTVLSMVVSATSSGILLVNASTEGEGDSSNGNGNGDERSDEPEQESGPEPDESDEVPEPELQPEPEPEPESTEPIIEDEPGVILQQCPDGRTIEADKDCSELPSLEVPETPITQCPDGYMLLGDECVINPMPRVLPGPAPTEPEPITEDIPVCDFDEFVNDDNECEKIPEDPVTAVLPPCDGSFQDCVTPNGDVCLAGASTHECELPNPGDEEVSPGVLPEPPIIELEPEPIECPEDYILNDVDECIPEPEPEPPVFNPDENCMFDPSQPKCIPPEGEDCPEGFGLNEDGQCFFRHDQGCPDGYHSHEDDESGKCIPDDVPCEPGYVRDPDYPTCNDKERVCEEHPNADVCKDDDDDDDDDREKKTKVIVEIIKKKIVRHENIVHGKSSFPDVDIIGLSTKDNGDSMVCLMDISSSQVQCQDFGMPNDKVDNDFSRIIEVDEQNKEYDNGGTGSSIVNDAIQAINDQDFNELEDLDNHDFNIDLAVFGINPDGDGMVCLVKDDRGFGKSLCEPFKIAENVVSGQITEAVEFS